MTVQASIRARTKRGRSRVRRSGDRVMMMMMDRIDILTLEVHTSEQMDSIKLAERSVRSLGRPRDPLEILTRDFATFAAKR